MSARSICLYPAPVLRKKTKWVREVTKWHQKIIQDLIDTLKMQPGGIGIAAPQIGYGERIAVVDLSKKEKGRQLLTLINPTILGQTGEYFGREGCMSIPDFTGNVKRALSIKFRWWDKNFIEHVMSTDGLEAVCIQHEIDHLDGLLFIDRVGSMMKDVFKRKKYL